MKTILILVLILNNCILAQSSSNENTISPTVTNQLTISDSIIGITDKQGFRVFDSDKNAILWSLSISNDSFTNIETHYHLNIVYISHRSSINTNPLRAYDAISGLLLWENETAIPQSFYDAKDNTLITNRFYGLPHNAFGFYDRLTGESLFEVGSRWSNYSILELTDSQVLVWRNLRFGECCSVGDIEKLDLKTGDIVKTCSTNSLPHAISKMPNGFWDDDAISVTVDSEYFYFQNKYQSNEKHQLARCDIEH